MLRRWILVAVVALVATTATTAHAARLGGASGVTAKTLSAFSVGNQDALPFTLVQDTFTDGNVSLDGRSADGTGPVWHIASGTLVIRDGSYLRTTGLGFDPYAAAVVEASRSAVRVSVGIRAGTDGGLLLNSDPAARNAIVARWTGTQLQIVRLTNGVASTALTSVTVTGVPVTTFTTMTATTAGGTYTVSLPGVPPLTYTLPAADQPAFGSRTLMGVAFWSAGGDNRLDDFLVTK